jgi:hypothetical protein
MTRSMLARRATLIIMSGVLSGCTEVQIYGARHVTTHYYFGVESINVNSLRNPYFIQLSGSGIILGIQSVVLGWAKEQIALFPSPNRCAILIVAPSKREVGAVDGALRRAGSSLRNVCIAGRIASEKPGG